MTYNNRTIDTIRYTAKLLIRKFGKNDNILKIYRINMHYLEIWYILIRILHAIIKNCKNIVLLKCVTYCKKEYCKSADVIKIKCTDQDVLSNKQLSLINNTEGLY